jgi:hypothetical protein
MSTLNMERLRDRDIRHSDERYADTGTLEAGDYRIGMDSIPFILRWLDLVEISALGFADCVRRSAAERDSNMASLGCISEAVKKQASVKYRRSARGYSICCRLRK